MKTYKCTIVLNSGRNIEIKDVSPEAVEIFKDWYNGEAGGIVILENGLRIRQDRCDTIQIEEMEK